MKHNYVMIIAALVVGIGIGVAVDRAQVADSKPSEPSDSQPSARAIGPRAASGGRANGGGATGGGAFRRGNQVRDPVQAIQQIIQEIDSESLGVAGWDYTAMTKAYEAISWMGPEDVRLALIELDSRTLFYGSNRMLRDMLMEQWARVDGQGAANYAMKIKGAAARHGAVVSSLQAWVKHDVAGAYAWYRENQYEIDGWRRGTPLDAVFFTAYAQRDVDMAFNELKQFSVNAQESALRAASGAIARNRAKREQFIQQIDSIEDERLKKSCILYLTMAWTSVEPLEAVAYLEQVDMDSDSRDFVRDKLVYKWRGEDPEAAMKWQLDNMEDDEVAGADIAKSFGSWVASEPRSAVQWLEQQPENIANDAFFAQAYDALRYSNADLEAEMRFKIQSISERLKRIK